jgi:chemotaxis protein MotB
MARQKKPEQPSAGMPWLNTFADLMNLLLCFFVLLFACSTVDADKYENIATSMASNFSIFSGGGSSLSAGQLISSGINQLNDLDQYNSNMGENEDTSDEDQKQSGTDSENSKGSEDQKTSTSEAMQALLEQKKQASQEMYDKIAELAEKGNVSDIMELSIDSNYQYIKISLSGSVLFDSGEAEIKKEALPILSKVGDILKVYKDYHIELEGHTDNVPIHNSNYSSNNWLSSARALNAAMYLVEEKGLSPKTLSWTGRGEYDPVESNTTAEGRAKNRRVEIKIYNK